MIAEKFLENVRKYRLFQPGEKVLVGVSGGADSVALLHLLYSFRSELNISPHVVHLHHGIRGWAADRDAQYVEKLAKSFSFPIAISKVDVPRLAKEKALGLEEAAREARYNFFAEVAQRIGAKKVVLAHTADDQVETYLMRFIRGAGTRGLAAMRLVSERSGKMSILRPLLSVWKKEVEEYCQQKKLRPRTDLSNFITKYFRNRTRYELIPYLERVNPGVKELIFQSAELAREDEDYFSGEISRLMTGKEPFALKNLRRLPFSLLSRLILRGIEAVKGDLKEIGSVHVLAIAAKIADDLAWELHLPQGIYVSSDGRSLFFTDKQPKKTKVKPFLYSWKVPGALSIPEAGLKLTAFRTSSADLVSDDGRLAYLDQGLLKGPLTVRNVKAGDNFKPLGMTGKKKLSDFFIDQKVPREERAKIPLLVSGKSIVWVVGQRIDERFKVTEKTKKVLGVKIE